MSQTRYIISDAAKMIDVEPHVLRYWEEELGMEIPRNEMGHRYYTDKEVKIFTAVRDLKAKGFQLKAIKMVLSAIVGQVSENNIISLDAIRKKHTVKAKRGQIQSRRRRMKITADVKDEPREVAEIKKQAVSKDEAYLTAEEK